MCVLNLVMNKMSITVSKIFLQMLIISEIYNNKQDYPINLFKVWLHWETKKLKSS